MLRTDFGASLSAAHTRSTVSVFAWALQVTLFGLVVWLSPVMPSHCLADEPQTTADGDDPASRRVTSAVEVLYDFRSSDAGVVHDQSGAGRPLNLTIHEPQGARSGATGLILQGKTSITSDMPAGGLVAAARHSGALSVEIWMRPQSLTQSGPARIVTLSKNGSERNFTLGQDGDKLDFRLRTTATNTNGIPSLASGGGVVHADLMHVVCTHSRSGVTRIFVNGDPVARQTLKGDFGNWDNRYHLAVGNEFSGDRPWQGAVSLLAIYSRDLTDDEVRQNHAAGLPDTADAMRVSQADLNARHFETSVAPILSRHCLECHDPSTAKGGLDLSRRDATLQGGDSGIVLVAGNAGDSPLWLSVESDEMPHDRTPLSAEEKVALKKWIDDGAEWPLAVIDPAIYLHGNSSQAVFVQRLTVSEYVETVRSLLGVDLSEQARQILPPDLRADGFSNTAYNLTVDLAHVEAYMRIADLIVDQIDAAQIARQFTKSRELSDENLVKVVDPLGRMLLRGPLSDSERLSFLGVSTSVAAAGGDFDEVVRYIVSAMLQSPRFLYRIESQRGDGSPWPVTQYELASRLSYILWGGPPDEELLRAAERNELVGDALAAQVDRMLRDDSAVRQSKRFISEWLNLGHLKNLRPDAERFPAWDPVLADDMRDETLAYFEDIVWTQHRPMVDLLNAQVTFATPRLASYYGLPMQESARGGVGESEPVRFDLAQVPQRGGLLTQGSTLTVGGEDASMVTRGLFVMHELLRGVVNDPPPCVDATPTPSLPGLTQRGIAQQRLDNASCQGCHAKFETLSFGLEKFDGLAAFHEQDRFGNTLREDGTILFPGQAQGIEYQNSAELMDLLAGSDRVKESITWKMAQFAVARPLGGDDAVVMANIHQTSQSAGGRWTDIIKAIVLSDLVQLIRTQPDSDR